MKISFKDIAKVENVNMRGGKGSVFLQKVTPNLEHNKVYALITIPPHCSIGPHTHIDDEEAVTCLKGKGELIIDNKRYDFLPMDVSLCKSGRNHSIENNSEEDLVVLAVINQK